MQIGEVNIPQKLVNEIHILQQDPAEMEADMRILSEITDMIIRNATAGKVENPDKTLKMLAEFTAIKETYKLLGGTEND